MKNRKTEGAVRLCVLLAMVTDGVSRDSIAQSLDNGTDEYLCEGINASAETIAERFGEDLGEVRTLGASFARDLNPTGGPGESFASAASSVMAYYQLRWGNEAQWALEAAQRLAIAGNSRDVEAKTDQLRELARRQTAAMR